jgi:hypothetical protein
MANPKQPAKSGNNWTRSELSAFNIEIKGATTFEFFNTRNLPVAHVSETILNNFQQPDGPLSKMDRKFFQYMEAAENPGAEDSAVNDFVVFLLSLFDYDRGNWLLRTGKEMFFYMCGEHVNVKPGVVLMDYGAHLLLVLEDKVNFSASSSTTTSYS